QVAFGARNEQIVGLQGDPDDRAATVEMRDGHRHLSPIVIPAFPHREITIRVGFFADAHQTLPLTNWPEWANWWHSWWREIKRIDTQRPRAQAKSSVFSTW